MKLYTSIADRLRSQHLTIHELIKGLDEEAISKKPSEEKWSIHDNIAHIALYHVKFLNRLELIKNEEELFFERYKPEEDPDFAVWQIMSTEELLNKLEENRKRVIDYIEQLSESELEKTATHQKFGRMNVVQWIEFFLLHEAHHIYTIFKLSRSA